MIVELLLWVISFLFTIGFLLHLLNYNFFKFYTSSLLTVVWFVIQVLAGVALGLVLSLPSFLRGGIKGVVIIAISIVLSTIYLITFVIPFVGKHARGVEDFLKGSYLISSFAEDTREMRGMMVEIVAEVDEREFEFDGPERYRKELKEVKENGKDRLERGESLLSIALGSSLLVANLAEIKILQSTVFGTSASILVEFWLLAIAVSIIYRTSILEFLAYSPGEEFKTIEEMDVALGYQRAISLIGIIQGLTFLVIFFSAITRVKHDTLRTVLKAKYADEPWLSKAWNQITK